MNTRVIEGFPDYEVSDMGQVISSRRRTTPRRVLRGSPNALGYVTVWLCRDGEQVQRPVHQLVAEAFHGPRPEGMEVRHLDGNQLNNAASNLRYGTRSENVLDRVVHGTHPQANRTHCPQGHPYSGDNLYITPGDGGRGCRTCRIAATRRWRARTSAA